MDPSVLEEKKTPNKGNAKQEVTEKGIKCFVNLDEDMDSFDAGDFSFPKIDQSSLVYGPEMQIDAILKSNNTKGKKFNAKWSIDSDGNNTNVNLQGGQDAVLEHAETAEVDHTVEPRYFTNKLTLPDIGGDKHTVTVTKVNTFMNRDILKLNIETWRGIWFTIFWTDDSQVALINEVASTIKRAFVTAKLDMVHVPATAKLDYDHVLSAIVSSDDAQEDFVKGIHGGQHPALQRKPFHMQIIMVKNCAKLKKIDIKVKIDQHSLSKLIFDNDSITGVEIDVPLPNLLLTDDKITQVGKTRANFTFATSINSLSVSIAGGNSTPVNGPYTGTRDTLQKFTFSLTGANEFIAKAISEGKEVDFDFTIEVADRGLAGQNKGNKIVIQTHELAGQQLNLQSAGDVSKVLIHEIGHALDLVPPTNFRWTHPNHYTQHGGTGPHCKHNAELDLQGIYRYRGAGKMCVMYHQVHPQAGPEFCENCMKYLMFTKLRKDNLLRPINGWTYTT